MVDRHYSLNLKPWSARTLYVYAHADLAQEIFVSRLCSQEENYFFLPWVQCYLQWFTCTAGGSRGTWRKPVVFGRVNLEALLSHND